MLQEKVSLRSFIRELRGPLTFKARDWIGDLKKVTEHSVLKKEFPTYF